MNKFFKKTVLSFFLAGTLLAATPANALLICISNIGTLARCAIEPGLWIFGGLPAIGALGGVGTIVHGLLPQNSLLGADTREDKRSAILFGLGNLALWGFIFAVLDESQPGHLAELNSNAKDMFGLTNEELQSYNESRQTFNSLINHIAVQKAQESLSDVEANKRLIALAKNEIPAEALSAYTKITLTIQKQQDSAFSEKENNTAY